MDNLQQYLPFLIPVAVLEVLLLAAALIHLVLRKKTRNLNPLVWGIIIVVFQIAGPALYFLVGREEN